MEDTKHVKTHSPLFHGEAQTTTKSMIAWSISSTVVLVPRIIVKVGVWPAFSNGIPPLNITNGSLLFQATTQDHTW